MVAKIQIPENWKLEKISQIAPLQRGFDLPTKQIVKGEYPVVYSNGILNYHNNFLAKAPGVVTGRSGTIGKVTYVEQNYWPHNTSLWVTDFKGNDPKFIFYLFSFLKLARFSTGSGVPTLNRNDVHAHEVLIPKSHEEQVAIAQVLSDSDDLIESFDNLIEKKENIKQAAMQELLTGKKRLPEFNGAWKQDKLENIVEINKGELITEKSRVNGEVPVIAGGKTPAYFHNKANRIKKTITISCSGANAGYISFHTEPIFASDCSTIEEEVGYSIEYIYFKLLSFQKKIYRMQTGGAQPHIHPSDLNPIVIEFPKDKEEQSAIAQVLLDMASDIEALEQKRDKYRQLKKGMMQQLLTGRIRLKWKS